MIDLKALVQLVLENKSPDLHLQVGNPPMIRLKTGELVEVENQAVLTVEDVKQVIEKITTEEQRQHHSEDHELDFSYDFEGLSRFRVNIYEEQHGPAVAMRVISEDIPSLEELGLPPVVEQLCNLPRGLVLVTGPTGMGKSTTLASMIDYVNQHHKKHIITIEDPIEFVYENKESMVTQREVSQHTHSFSSAIRSALRQDPDVVMVGEMRDLETIAAALTLAETGHLVFSTLHTSDAAQTIDRIVDVFPPYQQQQIRAQLATSLKGVISQTLVPRLDGEGRVAAREIMVTNDAVRNCIAKAETPQLYSIMQIGASEGMVLLDKALEELYSQGIISAEEALAKASDFDAMQQTLSQYVTA